MFGRTAENGRRGSNGRGRLESSVHGSSMLFQVFINSFSQNLRSDGHTSSFMVASIERRKSWGSSRLHTQRSGRTKAAKNSQTQSVALVSGTTPRFDGGFGTCVVLLGRW